MDRAIGYRYEVINRDKSFFTKGGKTFERVSVFQRKIDIKSEQIISEQLLYTDICEVGYSLPEGTVIFENEE